MSDQTLLYFVDFLSGNAWLFSGLIIGLAFLVGWFGRGATVKSSLDSAIEEAKKAQDSASALSVKAATLEEEQAQTLKDAETLRQESLAENDTLKYLLDDAKKEVEKSRTEIMVLSQQLPQAQDNSERVLAMRDALAAAQADMAKLSQDLDVKTTQLEKLKHKADVAIANAVDITPNTGESPAPDMANWRARFFESRIRLLEAQLRNNDSERLEGDAKGKNDDANQVDPHEDKARGALTQVPTSPATTTHDVQSAVPNAESADLAIQQPLSEQTDAAADIKQTQEQATREEELASLRWRVRYLETRLSNLDPGAVSSVPPSILAASVSSEDANVSAEGDEEASDTYDGATDASDDVSQSPIKRLADNALAQLEAEKADRLAAKNVSPRSAIIPTKPQIEGAPDLQGDSIVQIPGIGPLAAKALSRHGVTSIDQLATLTEGECLWLENEIGLGGRMQSEDWVGQAQTYLRKATDIAG